MLEIVTATTPAHMAQVRELLVEYAAWLGISLCFQGFDEELESLPGRYAPPGGLLLLGLDGDRPVCCIGVRPMEDGVCEMKRLYVRPSHRGQGVGEFLVMMAVGKAECIGYKSMRLDTLPVMATARQLYRRLGFREIEPYYTNPVEGVVYMEIALPVEPNDSGDSN
ncbi:MAG TPA: GNAT family N-acetyltransferase [Candidatus Krumholzibacteria bacterium]|nr:GNAT family N-acetyltransferase [Candidatus Krumholzibacteria bacterium]